MTLPTLATYTQDLDLQEAYLWKELLSDPVSLQKGLRVHPLLLIPQGIACGGVARVFSPSYHYLLDTFQDKNLRESLDPRRVPEMAAAIITKTEADPTWIDKYLAEFRQLSLQLKERTDDTYWNFRSTDFKELAERFEQLVDAGIAPQCYGYMTEVFSDQSWVHEYLRALNPQLSQEELVHVLEPTHPSFLQQCAQLAATASFDEVKKEYYWVRGSYYALPDLTSETLPHSEEKTVVPKQFTSEKQKALVHVMEQAITLQDERKVNVLRLNYAIQKILQLMREVRPEWSLDTLFALSPHELLQLLSGDASVLEYVGERNFQSVWVFGPESYCLTSKPEVVTPIFKLFELSTSRELTGHVAFRGKVTGRVKIVLSEDDFNKVEEGDVLVAWMTRPEYVPVLKKVAAIITNEGGITCHAAIVARELKKPCIVDTKHATSVLKDGDMVEVDAETGKIKILGN
jgi:phosphohistidine swiveling domain-containing protein